MNSSTRHPIALRVLRTLKDSDESFRVECETPQAAESLRRTLYNALRRERMSASIRRSGCALTITPKRAHNANIRPAHAPQ